MVVDTLVEAGPEAMVVIVRPTNAGVRLPDRLNGLPGVGFAFGHVSDTAVFCGGAADTLTAQGCELLAENPDSPA